MTDKYTCDICGKKFSYKKSLYNHKKITHQEITEKEKKLVKISRRDTVIISIILFIILSVIIGWFLKPYILIFFDQLTNNVPNPYVSFTVTDRIHNKDYINLNSNIRKILL